MGQEPDQIRRDIEQTRRDLGEDLDLLTEKVSPARVVERNVNRVKGGVTTMKDRVMGSASDATSSVSDTAAQAPAALARKTEGNPLAAGLIAFGAGWLVSSLIPATRPERQATAALKDKATEVSGPVTDALSEAARDMKDNLAEPVKQSVESVKQSTQSAVHNVSDQATASRT
jgi:hypothetical protein